ncbi:hypothetical protein [Mesorhizobium jarvisii]|uniref:hypothetical protein n=1 Tax=Mesorhizobium jarvisii TaxID=1777867 RepID=UPI001F0B22BD|nr:hypothetical protein [Mesorhizobium jarvisii]MCH4560880.1 hypothetical protein [Mesorhizobium jarvisii]
MSSVSNDRGVSQLAAVNSTFFHFIFVQVLALIWAFLFSGTAVKDLFEQLPKSWIGAHNLYNALYLAGSAIGYLLLVYSVLLVLAAAMAIYRLAMIKDPADTSSS